MQPTPAELSQLRLFDGLSGAQLVEARACFVTMTVAGGEVLMGQGQAASWMALIMSGSLRISRGHAGEDEVPVADLGPGEVVGEMGLMGGLTRRTATVRSTAVTRLLVLDQWGLARLRRTQPEVAERLDTTVARALARRLRETTSAIVDCSSGAGLARPTWRSWGWLAWIDRGLSWRSHRPDPRQIVDQAPALSALTPHERRRFSRAVRVRSVPRGTPLIDEGEPSGRGFLLASGEVEVTRHGSDGQPEVLATLETPGTAFGFASLVDEEPSLATCATARPSWVLEVDRRALVEGAEQGLVRKAAIGSVTRRLGVADRVLGRLKRRRVEGGP